MKLLPTLRTFLMALVCACAALHSASAEPEPSPAAASSKLNLEALKEALAAIRPQTGDIEIRNGLAKLHIPDGFVFLDHKDSVTVLVDFWHNPPASAQNVIGMIVESKESVLEHGATAVVVDYTEDGHIDDSDASKIDYTNLLKQMQAGTQEANAERKKAGYSTVELVGWAEPPHYDSATHKIYWAKELAFSRSHEHTLNYCIRILGRQGVLELNAVAPVSSLPSIRESAPKMLAMVDFNTGNRYADFDNKTDKLATYGLAALVAGGIATKMGFFKLLLVAILAAKKFVIVGVVAASSAVKKFFGGRKKEMPVRDLENLEK